MHKSRLAVVAIDCETDNLDQFTSFWANALGCTPEGEPVDPKYRDLKEPKEEMRVLLQAVDHPPRVCLDMETDNIPAEAERLKQLGAREVGACKGWVVMEAPRGHRFCFMSPQRPDFEVNAVQWI
ncbi:hypothetical protein JM93_02481 [Roseibium hamelinense]|uniref:Glyoxalase-like domain-containing protein n=1 Tax=Roseibium hamelinense TaxID=150831 RepID=A0A562T0Z1_9HYPH|nr:VOC family protein [Roseibium hamelinense]MTI44614.1 VOC family protein [Roseibium hamelinense]TWI87241.1 hypothetical protein JM93_02481 [Roseibium hamelinense]